MVMSAEARIIIPYGVMVLGFLVESTTLSCESLVLSSVRLSCYFRLIYAYI